MSHISLVKVSIRTPNLSLLRRAVESLAEELRAEIVTEVHDYYGNSVSVELGIRNSVFWRGVGFVVEEGELKLKGDFFDIEVSEVERLKSMLVKHYTVVAAVTALRNMGYEVKATPFKEAIYIKASAW